MKFIRLQYWPAPFKVWYNRPLLCILNLHHVRPHPADHTWAVCGRCEGEGQS